MDITISEQVVGQTDIKEESREKKEEGGDGGERTVNNRVEAIIGDVEVAIRSGIPPVIQLQMN